MDSQLPFANDTFVPLEFLKLKKEFDIQIAVETGTHQGTTTYWLAENFESVFTIETNPISLANAKEYCKKFDNITYLHGHSEILMKELIPKIKEMRTIFFLDAHGDAHCPTFDELDFIKDMEIKPIIVIHDFCVPGKDFAWGYDYKWENIEKYVNKIYGYDNYEFYYNSEANGYNVGVIYIKPKN